MKIAVVTPYYKEPIETLAQCHGSVAAQTHPCLHVMVADRFPNPAVRDWPVVHLELPPGDEDGRNTARYAGALAAIAEGAEAIAFLDADNWFRPDHIATMVALTREAGADIGTAQRALHRLDGSFLGLDTEDSVGGEFADTNCLFIRKPAFGTLEVWGAMPPALWSIDDRIFSLALKQRVATHAHSAVPTVSYRTGYPTHYRQFGEAPPSGLADKITPASFGTACRWPSGAASSWPAIRRGICRRPGPRIGRIGRRPIA
jgi:hypothetical protein